MPATPKLRGERQPDRGHWPWVGLEGLEPRALLSTCPQGDPQAVHSVTPAAVSAAPAQPANRAAAIAEAMKALGLNPVVPGTGSSSSTTPAATPGSSHSRRGRRVKPLAIRAHVPPPSTVTPTPSQSSAASALLIPPTLVAEAGGISQPQNSAAAFDPFHSLDSAADALALSDVSAIGGAALAAGRIVTPTSPLRLRATVSADVWPQLSHASASPFGATRITDTFAPAIATRLVRASSAASSVLALATGELPDWLFVGPQGQYVFSDRELFFKAGAMVLSVAGLVAGYCGYLQVTRARRHAEARAKVEMYSLLGWKESF